MGLGEKAKTFIHSIDSLDASKEAPIYPVPKGDKTIDQLVNYNGMRVLYSTTNTQDNSWVLANNKITILYGATMTNDATPARPMIIIKGQKGDVQRFYAEPGVASATGRFADACKGLTMPIVLPPGAQIIFRDVAWQAGHNVTTSAIYYEVEV